MAAMNVVLTLPGIAGIVLTLGMAVDANILIYERILEELRVGKSQKGAIEAGFNNALSAIVDSNLTTLLAGVILYIFGIGPIRGFAVTLIIGVIGTLLTGILITRLLVEGMYASTRWSRWLRFRRAGVERILGRPFQVPFSKHWKVSRWIVAGLFVISTGILATLGVKRGLEFTGGYQFQVALTKPADIDILQKDLSEAMGGASVVVKSVGAKNDVLISTSYLYDQPSMQDSVERSLLRGLKKSYADAQPQIVRSALIGPTIAEDIQSSAYKSVLMGILGIALYILLRFRSIAYSVGSALSLTATVVIGLGLYGLLGHLEVLPFSLEANQDTIAALLTIVGYVINDNVVFFDRVREERRRPGAEDKGIGLIHAQSLNLVLIRTILTTFTSVLTLLTLLVVGGENTKAFSFLMAVGFVLGVFSTMYVAADISHMLYKALQRRREKRGLVASR
jgi:SecD/SecF fusion protein